ncbi:hypothetical protein [Nocardioides antri]|uniref:Exo-alpha-sialidase n=1 Tax=Nocardioides antri TaxID=2607659 RepID=A0A5B1LXV6_9ACTN|nr:hypothetical protein [Nocardioides antri]KAA1424280.1 hypothetical protein F0U47_18760 [Nocardioides antri]
MGMTACSGDSSDDGPPATPAVSEVRVEWREVALPEAPRGRRVAVRDAAWCGDRWVVVGGLLGPGGASRPAAWTSPDGRSWGEVRFPTSTYWGGRAVLATVACRGTVPVAVGAMSGGAHGNPRVVTFRPEGRGVWVDVAAPFEQYGGPSAVNVGPVTSGDDGWLITGNRRTGPAAWVAVSPRRFHLVERAPGLVGDGSDAPLARGAVWDGSGWTIVGGSTGEDALDRVPVAWRSTNGRDWVREPVPDTAEYDDLYRAVLLEGSVVAVGVRGPGFGSWVRDGAGWHRAGAFGGADPEAPGAPAVTSATSGPGGVLTTVTDGAVSELWGSVDGTTWSRVELPAAPAGDGALAVASSDAAVLLVADGGDGSQAWIAHWPDLEGAG